MRESTRHELIASAEERAREFRPDVERSVAEGAAQYRSRLHRFYGITIAVLVVVTAGLFVAYPAIGELLPRNTDTITVTPEAPTMMPGDSLTLEATVHHADGSAAPNDDVEWASSNWSVATVENGTVAAAAVGTAVITAQVSGVSGTVTVTVIPQSTLTAIALDPAEVELQPGQDVDITATGAYDDAESADLTASATWTSSDAAVATVDDAGHVSAVAPGTTLISASAEGVSGTATVTVGDVELVGVRIDPARVQLHVGEAQALTVVGEFSDGSAQPLQDPVTWTSSDTKSVQVDDVGVVTAITASTTSVITAAVRGFSPTATVEVLGAQLVGITVTPGTATINQAGEAELAAEGAFDDGTKRPLTGVTWSSSNTTVATVDATGLVRAVAVGKTTVTAAVDSVSGAASVTVEFQVE